MARAVSPRAIAVQLPPYAALSEECEEQLGPIDPWKPFLVTDDSMSESEVAKAIVAENRKYIYYGEVTPALQVRMERGTAPQPVARHRLHKDCKSCKKCPACYDAAPGYLMKLATTKFAKYVQRVQIQDVKPPLLVQGVHPMAKYVYTVKYLVDPAADVLPVNYETAHKRHVQLRANFTKLTDEKKNECNQRLTSGIAKGYWRIIEGKDLERMRQPGSGAHFLPSGYVLKPLASGASTKVRLVLDPSLSFNQRLLPLVNIKNTIASVLRKLQALPICNVQDIQEA